MTMSGLGKGEKVVRREPEVGRGKVLRESGH